MDHPLEVPEVPEVAGSSLWYHQKRSSSLDIDDLYPNGQERLEKPLTSWDHRAV